MKFTSLIIISLSYVKSCFGWGMMGHRITGEIASYYISNKTAKTISDLTGSKSLASLSNHADFIKSDPVMRKKYNHWHYISYNQDLSVAKYHKTNPKKENIIHGIKYFSTILKDKKSKKKEKIFALKMLIHFVGDIHQPLHVGRASDHGGGKIQVSWFGASTNLHAVWDSKLIQLQKLSYTEYAKEIGQISKQNLKLWRVKDITRWAQESKDYVPKIYSFKKGKYWEYGHNYKHKKFLEKRLQMGGVRLAHLLDDIFIH